jgi:hypothetical protein
MDLALYLRVIWRFKFLFAAGFILAVGLAFLSVEKVSFKGGFTMSPRKQPTYKTDAYLLVTQSGFPWGRSQAPYTRGNPVTGAPSVPISDPQRFAQLTGLYAQLATGDAVRQSLHLSPLHPELGTVSVTAVAAPPYSNPAVLPVLDVAATGPTAARAADLALRASASFRTWLAKQQESAGIPDTERVYVTPITKFTPPVIVSHSHKMLPVIVFISLLGITFGTALVLENLRPRSQRLSETESAGAPAPVVRQSA